MKIKKISIEIHNKCTRQCSFCPGSISDNIHSDINGNYREINTSILNKICDNIIQYRKYFDDNILILFYGFAELSYNSHLIKLSLNTLHNKLNNIITYKTKIISNGDLINEEFFNNIKGLNELTINDYQGIGLSRLLNILKKSKIHISKMSFEKINIHYIKKCIRIYCSDINLNILYVTNTNDIKPFNLGSCIYSNYSYIRTQRCGLLGQELMFDSNGVVKVCTNVNQDISFHKELCKWNIINNNIEQILNDIKKINIPKPCLHCDNRWEDCLN